MTDYYTQVLGNVLRNLKSELSRKDLTEFLDDLQNVTFNFKTESVPSFQNYAKSWLDLNIERKI